jgi:hypothetical protein
LKGNDFGGRIGWRKIFAQLAQDTEDGLTSTDELGFAAGEKIGVLRTVHDSATGCEQAGEFGNGEPRGIESGSLDVHFMIQQSGVEGEDAGETPVDGSEFASQAILYLVGRLDAADVVGDEILESCGVFVRENDCVGGVAAVLEGVKG